MENEQTVEPKALQIFRSKCEGALSRIQSIEEFRDSDKMIDYVFKSGRELFENELDLMGDEWLVRKGARLTGIYAYLGNLASLARAERDVYSQKLKEVESELLSSYLDSDYKVTKARACIEIETSQIHDEVAVKENQKNNMENLLYATDKMVSFVQSALRMKNAERYRSNQMEQS